MQDGQRDAGMQTRGRASQLRSANGLDCERSRRPGQTRRGYSLGWMQAKTERGF